MNNTLRNRLLALVATAAAAGVSVGAVDIATVLGDHFEGTGQRSRTPDEGTTQGQDDAHRKGR